MKFALFFFVYLLVGIVLLFNACGGTRSFEGDPYIVSTVKKINAHFAKNTDSASEKSLKSVGLSFDGNILVYTMRVELDKFTDEEKAEFSKVLEWVKNVPTLIYDGWMVTGNRNEEDVATPEFFLKMYEQGMDVLVIIKDEKGKVFAKFQMEKETLKVMADYCIKSREMEESSKIFHASIDIDMFMDPRDKHIYRSGSVIDITWMLDNLAYGGNELYTWNEAKNACPEGWRLPTYEELINRRFQKLWPDYIETGKEPVFWSSTKKDVFGKEHILAVRYRQAIENGWGSLDSATIYLPADKADSPDEKHFVRCVEADMSFLPVNKEPLLDSRDGRSYKTIQVDSIIWMAEDLNLSTRKKGPLYTFNEAVDACPSGWRLPLTSEFDGLARKGKGESGKKSVYELMGEVPFWSMDMYRGSMLNKFSTSGFISYDERNKDSVEYSVRCVKGTPIKKVDPSSVKRDSIQDPRDGRIYQTTQIGSQTWIAENMAQGFEKERCDSYVVPTYCLSRGQAYTYEEAQNACPTGWRLPTRNDFDVLFLSMFGVEDNPESFFDITDSLGFPFFLGASDRVALSYSDQYWTSSIVLYSSSKSELRKESLYCSTYEKTKRASCYWKEMELNSDSKLYVRCIKE